MSQFCIDLEGMLLPDAIAAVVEAWYEAQNVGGLIEHEYLPYKPGEPVEIRDSSRPGASWNGGWVFYKYLNKKIGVCQIDKWNDALSQPDCIADLENFSASMIFSHPEKSGCAMRKLENVRRLHATIPNKDKEIIGCKKRIMQITFERIENGRLKCGDKMPSLRSIADLIGCHRNTALKIYQQLEEDGAIFAKPGSGFYIADASKLTPLNAI